jgi:hypothetical protein
LERNSIFFWYYCDALLKDKKTIFFIVLNDKVEEIDEEDSNLQTSLHLDNQIF